MAANVAWAIFARVGIVACGRSFSEWRVVRPETGWKDRFRSQPAPSKRSACLGTAHLAHALHRLGVRLHIEFRPPELLVAAASWLPGCDAPTRPDSLLCVLGRWPRSIHSPLLPMLLRTLDSLMFTLCSKRSMRSMTRLGSAADVPAAVPAPRTGRTGTKLLPAARAPEIRRSTRNRSGRYCVPP